jgi:hypothetical protein
LSFETIEAMLYSMKTLNLTKLKDEFLMLTIFHGHKFIEDINKMNIDKEIKNNLKKQVNDFLRDLLELAELDPNY